MKEAWEFARDLLRPRSVRAWWRLGSMFECAMWSYMYHQLWMSSIRERWERVNGLERK